MTNEIHLRLQFSKYLSFVLLCTLSVTLAVTSLLRNRVWINAITLWEDAVEKSPNKREPEHSARIYFGLGSEYAKLRDLTRANELYQKAIDLKPNYVRAHFEMGIIHAWQGNMDDAIKSFATVIDLVQHPAERWRVGSVMRPSDSGDLLEKSFNNIGSAYYKQGEYAIAINYFSNAISLNANYGDAWLHRAFSYRQMGERQEALRDFRTACELRNDLACAEMHK